jgi:hypothetical protein
VASIQPFIQTQADFDDHATQVMGEAFDAACAHLDETGLPKIVREIIAKRIIEAAKNGERNPIRLRKLALAALDPDQPTG